ncbi:hypothetical protein N801_10840 [Knoellia aerolata DSM 18566]|uniref:Uncharacterized protein n=1 Tax=Knoellia aerolata DSM 18566 TaxID=1385519 RepID=A0A0A0JTY7_9MICO|nr:hypothetical protein N801_10840 [Knoellia aerolata DSM 18566]
MVQPFTGGATPGAVVLVQSKIGRLTTLPTNRLRSQPMLFPVLVCIQWWAYCTNLQGLPDSVSKVPKPPGSA